MTEAKPKRPDITVSTDDLERLEGLLGELRGGAPEIADGLRSELDRARIVEPSEVPQGVVTMNSTVRFTDEESGKEFQRTLCYPEEVTGGEDQVSILAPLGSALLGLSVGQRIDWPVPGGRMARIRILDVVSRPARTGVPRG
ncbi:MAG: nucleoside diphosphate kinase regulator [Betaproteobacteria bacterium]|nr:nucleoside diphosphate kinase regulator [Betaproteobacteria bacterium]